MNSCSIFSNQASTIKIGQLQTLMIRRNQKKIFIVQIKHPQAYFQLEQIKVANQFISMKAKLNSNYHLNQKQNIFIIYLVNLHEDEISKIIKNGIKYYFQVECMKNLYSNADMIAIQYRQNNLSPKNLQHFIQYLFYDDLSKVLHGCFLKFENKQILYSENQGKYYSIITGGSRGIGKQTAVQMAKEGNNLILTGTPGNKILDSFAKQLQETYKIKVFTYFLDLKSKQSCRQFAQYVRSLNVKIKTIVYNGGVGSKTSEEQLQKGETKEQVLVQINTIGNIYLQNVMEQMKVISEQTLIFIVSSVGAFRGFTQMNSTDGCSKYMLQPWIQKLKSNNYNVMTIYPGATNTEMMQKSTFNALKQNNELQKFEKMLPKKIIINPHNIGYIINLFSKNAFKESLKQSKISACCGLHLDFAPLFKGLN